MINYLKHVRYRMGETIDIKNTKIKKNDLLKAQMEV